MATLIKVIFVECKAAAWCLQVRFPQ